MTVAQGRIGFVKDAVLQSGPQAGQTTHSFVLEGQDGWFSTYTHTPPPKGTDVSFEYSQKGNFKNVDVKTLKVLDNTNPLGKEPDAASSVTEAVMPGATAPSVRFAATHRDANINWQSARNAAIAMAQVAADAGILDVGTGAKASKLEALQIYIDQLTRNFFAEAMEVNKHGDVPEPLLPF